MNDQKVIKNYALALFENLKSGKDRQKVLNQMKLFGTVLETSAPAYSILCSPIVTRFSKNKLIEALAKKIKLEKIVKQFFALLIKNARFQVFPSIVLEYRSLLDSSLGVKDVVIESARKPDQKTLSLIKEFLENKLKTKIEPELIQNNSLIGGVVIKYDSFLYDYSVAGDLGRIGQMAKTINIPNKL